MTACPMACAMPADKQPIRDGPLQCPAALQLTIPGRAEAISAGLRTLLDACPMCNLPEDGRGTAELVLAEVLNNIVEHAYARHSGEIEVTLSRDARGILCEIADTGLPMPHEGLPAGQLPALDGDDLPEGGFGWHLIRTLSRDLEYRREGGKNLLRFRLES